MSILDDEIEEGRKTIMNFLGVKSWRTVRRRKKNYGLGKLMMILPNGIPFLLKCKLKLWLHYFNQALRGNRKKGDPK